MSALNYHIETVMDQTEEKVKHAVYLLSVVENPV